MILTRYTLTMHSDWHVGSGFGIHGGVDRVLRRDPIDDLPFVPAKTVTGIWRDACELLARGLDAGKGDAGLWHDWVAVLFGSQPAIDSVGSDPVGRPRPAALSVRPARYGDALRTVLKQRRAVRSSLTTVRVGVAIDDDNGRAIDQSLRFEEYGRVDSRLSGGLEIDDTGWTADQRAAAVALLVGGAKLVEHLGGNRRRGAGRCSLEVNVGDANDGDHGAGLPVPSPEVAVETLRAGAAMLPTPPEAGTLCQPASVGSTEPTTNYSLRLELLSPVCVPARTVGNVIETRDMIPGSLLLPAILRVFGPLLGDPADLRAMIRSGRFAVGDATVDIDGRAGRPIPHVFTYEKGTAGLDGGTVRNALVENRDGNTVQTQAYKGGYVGHARGTRDERILPRLANPTRQSFTHAVIDDDAQRPTAAVGGVYTLLAIAAGTVLRAEVRGPQGVLERLPESFEIRIGQSKKDDYGQVTVHVDQTVPVFDLRDDRPDDAPLFVWLLSDVLLRDERLRPSVDGAVFTRVLGDALGVTLELRPTGPDDGLPSWIAGAHRIDSWHAGWALPRPSLVGLGAGSVAVFQITGAIDEECLRRVGAEGIGERRAEGFGRLCFNDPFLIGETSKWVQQPPASTPAGEAIAGTVELIGPQDPDHALARHVERHAWRNAIGRGATRAAAEPGAEALLGFTTKRPGPSQLGTLRTMLDRLRTESNTDAITQWLARIASHPRKGSLWNGKDGPGPAAKLIPILKPNSEEVWACLYLEPKVRGSMTITTDGVENLTKELWPEAVRALVFECTRRVTDAADGSTASRVGATP